MVPYTLQTVNCLEVLHWAVHTKLCIEIWCATTQT